MKLAGLVALCGVAAASAVRPAGAAQASAATAPSHLAAAPTSRVAEASPSSLPAAPIASASVVTTVGPSGDPSTSPASGPSATATAMPTTPSPTPTDDWGVVAGPDWAVTNTEPLPACGLGEVMTPLPEPSDWALTLVDTTYAVGSGYAPDDIVSTSEAGMTSYQYVRSVMIGDLREMAAAASAAGAPLGIDSSYRDYSTQVWTFQYWVNMLGYDYAIQSSARPGHSEHQLGLAIDFKSSGGPDPWTYYDFSKQTAAGAWLAAHAWKFGFIMSYPLGSIRKTCYGYEPWHYRYVGVAEAAEIRASGLTLREWLWRHQPNPEPMSPLPSQSPWPTP